MIGHLGITRQSVASGAVQGLVQQTLDLAVAQTILQETGGTHTATGAEDTIYIENDPGFLVLGHTMLIDLDNMQAGDTTVFRVYYRLQEGGGLQLYDYNSYTGIDGGLANGIKLISIDLLPFRFGMQVTLDQNAGVNRAYDWQVFVEA